MNRVGLDPVKRKLLDDEAGRRAPCALLPFSLDGKPDPWDDSEPAQGHLRQFDPFNV